MACALNACVCVVTQVVGAREQEWYMWTAFLPPYHVEEQWQLQPERHTLCGWSSAAQLRTDADGDTSMQTSRRQRSYHVMKRGFDVRQLQAMLHVGH